MFIKIFILFGLTAISAGLSIAQTKNLEIYWIDVDGGSSTLLVTPSGKSLLVDTGSPGPGDRDAKRVFEAARAAGLKQIDSLVTTHYHGDHAGAIPALVKMIPIGHFYDHGDSIDAQTERGKLIWEPYEALTRGKRTILKPGDKLPLEGVETIIVSSNGQIIGSTLPGGGPNDLCASAVRHPDDKSENQRSVGYILTFGKFKFGSFGDLTWDKEMELACPVNKLGTLTLMQATHHGFLNDNSGAPAHVHALRPQVIIVNNSTVKGWQNSAWETVMKSPGLEDTWQLHKTIAPNHDHNVDDNHIANLENSGPSWPASATESECKGYWVKASIAPDGKFTVTNGRNGFSKTYTAR